MVERANWKSSEEGILVTTLLALKRRGLSSENGFKATVWQQVAETINEAGIETKTGKQVKSRWTRLKADYKVVKTLRDLSGFGWDDTLKRVTAEDQVWDSYIAKHEKAKFWRDHSFILYDPIAEIVDNVMASGDHAFSSVGGARIPVVASSGEESSDDEAYDTELLKRVEARHDAKTASDDDDKENIGPKDTSDDSSASNEKAPLQPIRNTPAAKRSRSSPLSSCGPRKKHRKNMSQAEAIASLANSLDSRFESIVNVIGAPSAPSSALASTSNSGGQVSASRRADIAFKKMVEQETLTAADFAYARRIFRGNSELAEEYLSFPADLAEARAFWLEDEIKRVKIEAAKINNELF